MVKWGFSYIENLTWAWLGPANSLLALPSRFVRRSHLTLYMFRAADKGKDIELRHQRSPDVTFDCVASAVGGGAATPAEVFTAIETLLPTAAGRFVELYASSGSGREGWTHVVEAGKAEA
jgi:N6-adenosine-specific RNA methylase IME4